MAFLKLWGRKNPKQEQGEQVRDQVLKVKIDNLTQKEAADLQAQIIKDKALLAPKARGTTVSGDVKGLPNYIRKALTGGKDASKKKP